MCDLGTDFSGQEAIGFMWSRFLLLLVEILLLWASVARHKLVGHRVDIRPPRTSPAGWLHPRSLPARDG